MKGWFKKQSWFKVSQVAKPKNRPHFGAILLQVSLIVLNSIQLQVPSWDSQGTPYIGTILDKKHFFIEWVSRDQFCEKSWGVIKNVCISDVEIPLIFPKKWFPKK